MNSELITYFKKLLNLDYPRISGKMVVVLGVLLIMIEFRCSFKNLTV